MYNFTPRISYRVGKRIHHSFVCENSDYSLKITQDEGSIKAVLLPKKRLELVSFCLEANREHTASEKFFANGYQSWTTTREYGAEDKVKDMVGVAKLMGFTRSLAGTPGDYHFTSYNETGTFHSFTYTYLRDRETVELFGSKSERVAYTIFQYEFSRDCLKIIKDVEGMVVDSECVLVDVLRFVGDYEQVFDAYFGELNLRKPKIDHLSGYTSWYNYFQKIDEKIILRDLNGLDRAKEETTIFQIDDGYESFVGDWLTVDSEKFPHGMKPIAEAIHQKGYLAGIWIAPFSAQRVSAVAKAHPDWLIKDNKTGKPLLGCVAWGGAYTLDFYNSEVREYIKHFFDVILNDWGYDMVKLDFLYSEAMQPRDGKSRGQIMCEAMDFLRECVGEEKLILGCGVPLGPSFGVVDACRISCDVSLKYHGEFYNSFDVNREIPSAQNAINNSIFRRHLNGRVFCSDPDVFFLRDNNLTFTERQKLLLAKVNNIFGDVLFVSDNVGDYPEKELELLKECFKKNDMKVISAEYGATSEIIVCFEEGYERKYLRIDLAKGDFVIG